MLALMGTNRTGRRSLTSNLRTLVRRIDQSLSADEPAAEPAGSLRLELLYSDDQGRVMLYLFSGGRHVGKLAYLACTECSIGAVLKISIYEPHDRQGVGRLLVRMLRDRHPGLAWYTTWQQPAAVDFWRKMAHESGQPYTARERFCRHPSPYPSQMVGPITAV